MFLPEQSDGARFTIGLALDGAGWHPAAWRDDAARPGAVVTAEYWVERVGDAATAGFDYVTIEDDLGLPQAAVGGGAPSPIDGIEAPTVAANRLAARLDALLIASSVAPLVPGIGLVPVVTTTHTEPFHVATALQTLDHISLGRAGWQVRISDSQSDGAFAHRVADQAATESDRLSDAADVASVARQLFDSWEDDAIIRDVERSRFLDRDKLHHIDFTGENFSITGPSIVPRSPQGQVPVVFLAHDAAELDFAVEHADAVFVAPGVDGRALTNPEGGTLVQEIRDREARSDRASRSLDRLRVVADLAVAIDTEGETGLQRWGRLDQLAGTPFDSDALILTGDVDELARRITAFRDLGFDGVRVRPLTIPVDATEIGARLLPRLRRDGVLNTDVDDDSLRARFGLPAAVNRYAQAAEVEA